MHFYFIHGWDGHPKNCWFPWLKNQLERKGHLVTILTMPNPGEPAILPWVETLQATVQVRQNTVLVGHSIGCQTILRFLATLPKTKSIAAVYLVAPFVSLSADSLADPDDAAIAQPWLATPIDWEKVKTHAKRFVALFSSDDPDVPINNAEIFQKKLGAHVLVKEGLGHFSDDAGVTQLPELLETITDL